MIADLRRGATLVARLSDVRARWVWRRREQAFRRFLNRVRWPAADARGGDVLVVVEAWLATPLPWFMLTVAAGLAARGRRVRIVRDDVSCGPDTATRGYEQHSIRAVQASLPSAVQRILLSDIQPAGGVAICASSIGRLAELNTIQKYRGEHLPSESDAYRSAVEEALLRAAARVEPLLQQTNPRYVVLGGGIYGSSGIFIDVGRRMGCRVATLDSGSGVMLAATDGIAAYLDDIPAAFRLLSNDDEWVVAEAEAELERRMQRKDAFQYQLATSTGQVDPVGVLLPLNHSFDSASRGRHRVFKNQTEWMLETVAWVLECTSETIAVRRHPSERLDSHTSNDDYAALLTSRFGRNGRLKYISADVPVNTYDLIRQASVVVPYVSTVGIEAAAMGKPVVTEGASCYVDLGFVWGAGTRDEYFGAIRRALGGHLQLSEPQRQAAWRCYYLTQCCNFLHTRFTPQPNDFDTWVKESPEAILSSPEIVDLLNAIDSATPLSLVRHARIRVQHQAMAHTGDAAKVVT